MPDYPIIDAHVHTFHTPDAGLLACRELDGALGRWCPERCPEPDEGLAKRRENIPVCDICGEEFKSAQGLAGYKRMQHADRGSPAEGAGPERAVVGRLRLPEVPAIFDGVREAYVTSFIEGTRYGINTALTGIQGQVLPAPVSTVSPALDPL